MNVHVPIPTRVRRLVPVLGSPNEGEVIATARAIGRTLNGAGLDFHALAQAIDTRSGIVPVSPRSASSNPRSGTGPASYDDWRPEWARRHRQHRWFTPAQELEQRRQLRFCLANTERLGSRERDFIRNVSSIRDGLTIAQADWLADLADRLDGEVRA